MDLPVIIGISVAVLGLLAVISYYNAIIGGHNRAQRAWADVLTYERQKSKVLDGLQPHVSHYQDYEHNLMSEITRLRSAIAELPSAANGTSLVAAESATRSLLNGLRVAVEAYPDLKASEVLGNFMREITEQQENVGAAIVIFNGEVERFNNSIQMLPGSMVNDMLNRKAPIAPFTDAEASGSFNYTPNL
ncbi:MULTISPECIES: LemA family protein [unclassified Pseudomonas]|jgi:LemA protein|uniref:LemA family protein n=1 Tax=unclassified Pseudomonas TaxID=196821 RepID=UPI001941F5CE|nr:MULTISPECIES: LemA family protein [unclassified Pseudomonas]MDC0686510.1 LemA family protein [Mitsuaria sp. RG]MCE0916715.1 LemA family protein [Pseudomonas sp. NMI760_13]MCF1487122.1 LemA family protein [Pseudomonas sp. AA27]MCP8635044.1 LemA family protein [Pseudomonas sp. DVZ6]MDD7785506.1 LemA family protein [Pseudomonas sp. DVZ24]